MKEIKTFLIRTYGCQMNELDSEVMAGILERRGLARTEDENVADLFLFNTCSVRDLAERKVLGKLGQLGKERPEAILGIAGCMASASRSALFQKLPRLDFVLGTNNLHELDLILDQLQEGKPVMRVSDLLTVEPDYTLAKRQDPLKAYVSIIRGCNKYCSYCIVPYTRGKEVSRHPDDILSECKKLAQNGTKEVMLLGQNVNSYGKDNQTWNCLFPELLERLDHSSGLKRIRFLTSHPVDISKELMEALRDLPTVCEHVHFPLQSGSNAILKKMNRHYTLEEYREKVHALKEHVPKIALGTDMIVGFPTETEDDFMMSCQALEEFQYETAYLFAYSPRPHTAASRWQESVTDEEKERRLQILISLQREINSKILQRFVGKEVEVLVEEQNSRNPQQLKGRTRCWKNVLFTGDASLIGTLQKVTVHSFAHETLIAKQQ